MEGKVLVPPCRPCAYRDDDVLPVQELSHFGGGESAGIKLPWVFSFFTFSVKNHSVQLWCGVFYPSTHHLRWVTPPPMGRPRGGSITKFLKKLLPAVPRRGPEAEVYHINAIFMIRVEPNRFVSFSPELKTYTIFYNQVPERKVFTMRCWLIQSIIRYAVI
jgi:hypothetical protein